MSVHSTPDERYFAWLYAQVADAKTRDPAKSHYLLCEQLYKTPFRYSILNDENRAEDGIDLREEYCDSTGDRVGPDWFSLECSIFELFIGLARRAAFQTNGRPDVWFWIMLQNLELSKYTDDIYHDMINDAVIESLDRFLDREYDVNGTGGLFPLKNPERDQRDVELWYQLSAYLLEQYDF